ncbi:3-hydroxyacyl-ACP dehydratase FabZ family protein [Zavarzinella formosa]|uniref:3-hydroxyacyl-ACP dehydratase FabZ family protein n=1 Tax=Zavarzinella formosa TaxID=360055 RepID=UPI0002FEFF34|nr:3-hydroxyacyl-ACP dehydratase FabZ family protein [Zavarzinella formosa]
MPPPLLIDPAKYDNIPVMADEDEVRRIIPHRFEMLHLNGVLSIDNSQQLIVGFKDVREDEFWVRGHFPNYPILPGVIMCEAAAQLLCYYAVVNKVMLGSLLGLGGIDKARFRGAVRPGDRLVIAAKGIRVDRRQTIFESQGFVNGNLAFNCEVIGVPIPGRNVMTEANNA